jgi:hypothetical protein
MRQRCSILVICAFTLFGRDSLHAQENSVTKIQVDWEEIMDRVSPAPQANIHVARHISLALKSGNQIDQDFSETSGQYQHNSSTAATLGGGAWHVGSAKIPWSEWTTIRVTSERFPSA